MTQELEARLNKLFNSFDCLVCDGWGTKSVTPSNPTGYPCDECSQTGMEADGSMLRDVRRQVNKVIENYIEEFK